MNRQQKKLKRLLNLTAALLQSRVPLTARQLRERIPDEAYSSDRSDAAFRRTFERDKRDLASIGVPVEVAGFAYGDSHAAHYSIDRAVYAERDLSFTSDELAALHLATRNVRLPGAAKPFIKTGIPDQRETASADIVGDRSPSDSESPPDTDSPSVELPFDPAVSRLASAAARRRAVGYAYRTAVGVESQREVEPWHISFARGHWYLAGWDRHRKGKRLYRVDRISGPIADIGGATHPVGEKCRLDGMKAWEFGEGPSFEARILVDPALARWSWHTTGARGEFAPDGSVVLTLAVRCKPAFRSFLLSMLDHAEVLEPRWLRSETAAWLEALARGEASAR